MEYLTDFLSKHRIFTLRVIILVYAVGIAGIAIQISRPLFIVLIPPALLISFIVIALFHSTLSLKRELIVFISVFILSFLIEVCGVNLHFPFGDYLYGHGLGIKIFGAPFMIGVNWVMVVYCSSSILELSKWSVKVQILLASALMVIYDLVLEQVAPLIDMWSWKQNVIPTQNFVAWFIIAIGFHTVLKLMKVKTINPVAATVFICQFLFFIGVLIFVK